MLGKNGIRNLEIKLFFKFNKISKMIIDQKVFNF